MGSTSVNCSLWNPGSVWLGLRFYCFFFTQEEKNLLKDTFSPYCRVVAGSYWQKPTPTLLPQGWDNLKNYINLATVYELYVYSYFELSVRKDRLVLISPFNKEIYPFIYLRSLLSFWRISGTNSCSICSIILGGFRLSSPLIYNWKYLAQKKRIGVSKWNSYNVKPPLKITYCY